MPETGLEPALPVKATRPSTWRVCQFRHSGAIAPVNLDDAPRQFKARTAGLEAVFRLPPSRSLGHGLPTPEGRHRRVCLGILAGVRGAGLPSLIVAGRCAVCAGQPQACRAPGSGKLAKAVWFRTALFRVTLWPKFRGVHADRATRGPGVSGDEARRRPCYPHLNQAAKPPADRKRCGMRDEGRAGCSFFIPLPSFLILFHVFHVAQAPACPKRKEHRHTPSAPCFDLGGGSSQAYSPSPPGPGPKEKPA